jgi:hypothetical protein
LTRGSRLQQHFLEACVSGTNFVDPVTLYSGVQVTLIQFTVSSWKGLLLKKFDADVATSADLRIRAVLVVDAGTTAPGTSSNPFEYISATKTVTVTPYGQPRLDLINSGMTQKVESALGNGQYVGFVKLDTSKPFTLKDPDTNKTYGAGGSGLAVNGSAIAVPTDPGSGWYRLKVDTNA